MKAEDLDPIDEEAVEVHEGHPVDMIVSVRLSRKEFELLSELAEREGTDPIETVRAALRQYAADRSSRAPG